MARKKTIEAIETEIFKVKSDMSKLQDRYDKLAEKLEELQEQKRRIEADTIMEAYLKSSKNFDEIMTFLNP